MANISTYLQKILDAVFGEEVRGSIHDALAAMNVEASSAMDFAATAKDSAQVSAASARSSAVAAEQNAAEADASASAAKLSEANAKDSEIVSAQKARETVEAAAEAKASETSAGISEAVASQKAQEAADAQSAAALSEAEAKAAEERSLAVKMDVELLGEQAAANKTAAEAARDASALSEANASASANTALTAKAEAETARDDAENAKDGAEAEKQAAEAAKISAETAAETAGWSKDAADKSAKDAAASAVSAQQYSGKPPKPQNGTWWIWDAGGQAYIDSGISCELTGPTGNGVADIQLTKGDHAPGTTDVYTVTMTDGTSYSISVYNGRNGTGSGDVLGIWFDLVIPAAGWVNGEITISDQRLLALSTHKYFLSADNPSREEFLDCDVQPKDITTTGAITFTSNSPPANDLTVNVVRLELAANGV